MYIVRVQLYIFLLTRRILDPYNSYTRTDTFYFKLLDTALWEWPENVLQVAAKRQNFFFFFFFEGLYSQENFIWKNFNI